MNYYNETETKCAMCDREDYCQIDTMYCSYCYSAYAEGVKAAQETVNAQSFFKGKTREREDIISLILHVRDTWERTPSFNYRTELSALVDLIESQPVNSLRERVAK